MKKLLFALATALALLVLSACGGSAKNNAEAHQQQEPQTVKTTLTNAELLIDLEYLIDRSIELGLRAGTEDEDESINEEYREVQQEIKLLLDESQQQIKSFDKEEEEKMKNILAK